MDVARIIKALLAPAEDLKAEERGQKAASLQMCPKLQKQI